MEAHPNHRRRKHGKKTPSPVHLKLLENKKTSGERKSGEIKSHEGNGVNSTGLSRNKNIAQSTEEKSGVFPRGSIWIVWILTVSIRMYIVQKHDSGWILHPDEVFQSVEVAHSLVYGYGFRPYEYLPPPDPNATLTVERQEAATGMYSLRSFIYPKIFAVFLWLMETCGINGNPFRMCRLFHAFVAAHLPVSVYLFMKNMLARSSFHLQIQHDMAILCTVLVSFSTPLTVLGTHSLINSFLAPVVFLSLSHFIKSVNETCSPKPDNSGDSCHTRTGSPTNLLSHSDCNSNFNNNIKYTAYGHNNGIGECEETCKSKTTEQNGNNKSHQTPCENTNTIGRAFPFSCFTRDYSGRNATEDISSSLNHPFQLSQSETHEHVDEPIVNSSYQFGHMSGLWFMGVLFGVLVYVRPDLLLLIGAISGTTVLAHFKRGVIPKLLFMALHVVFGVAIGITVGGLEDKRSFGSWFLSPYQWFSFNVQSGMSSTLFGSQDLFYYTRELFLRDNLSMLCLGLLVVMLILDATRLLRPKANATLGHWSILLKLIVPLIFLLGVYSLQKHKEVRFVHNVLVLFKLLVGVTIYVIAANIRNTSLRKVAIYIVLALWLSRWWTSLPAPQNKSNVAWAYQENWDTSSVNDCLEYVGRQPDSTGVFLDRSIHVTGGYGVIHKNIPIFTMVHYEFQEFGLPVQTRMDAVSWFEGRQISIAKLNRVSNFVTTENTPLLLKYLIEQTEYNYLVIRRDREIINVGYETIFSSGTMRVLRRSFSADSERDLKRIGESIPLGKNSTILEYEGSWLHTLGLHKLAIERLKFAMKISRPRARVFQLLSLCYSALGDKVTAQDLYEECLKMYGNVCSYPQRRVVLHTEYNLNLNIKV